MFNYSEQTFVNLKFKMLDLLRTIKADKEIKTSAKNVIVVTLSNTLSQDRTKLDASDNVKEIYIMDLELNTREVPAKFIDALNKYINFQLLFRLHYKDEIKYVISLKVFCEDKMKILKTFESDWRQEEKQELPLTTKLETIFKAIVSSVTKYAFCQNETFEQYADRMTAIKKQKAEIEKLIKMRDVERQPNKKIELNDKVRQMKKDLQKMEN